MELPAGASVALGVLVGLLSTCIQSIGLTQQRKSHLLEEQKLEQHEGHVHRPPYRRRRWQLGMLMFLVSNIVGSSIQITTLPLPVLSTLQASGLVFNTICATVVLGEPFTRYSLVGTLLVAAGAVLIGIFGSLTEPSHNLDQLLSLLGRQQFLLWLCGTFFIALLILIGTLLLKKVHPRNTHRVRLIRGMAFGSISGILSAHCLLLAKSAVELLVRTIADHLNQFNRWQSWMILLGLVFLALAQLYMLHRGLKLCSTSVLYPFVFCIYNIIAILDGLIYFDQGSRLPIRDAALIAVGTVILLGGVFALSWRLQADDHIAGPTAVDINVKARVPTPRTILQPGMGLAEDFDSEQEESPYLRPADDEEAIRHAHSLRASETTPLLRTKTGPSRPAAQAKKKVRSLRPPKLRRVTVNEEDTNELWDELHDRGDNRRFSGEYSPHSTRSPSFSRVAGKRSASGPRKSKTMPARRMSSGNNKLANLPWSLWDSGRSKRMTSRGFASPPPPSDPTDGEDTEGEPEALSGPSRRWSLSRGEAQRQQEARPGWFKLRWWKKRWRNDGEEDESNGDEE